MRTTYTYTPDDELDQEIQAGRTTTTGYDGLGRALTQTVQSLLIITDTTQQVWDGLAVVQQDPGEGDETSLVRDVTGDVAIQSTEGLLVDDTRWGLTDRLGSTIAQTQGSKVGQVAKYSDWGVPTFATLGWNSQTGYTGELSDQITGSNNYYARSYEPFSGSWLSADPYRGTLADPGTLARYAYVGGNPSTHTDAYGFVTNRAIGDWATPPISRVKAEAPTAFSKAPMSLDGLKTPRHTPTCGGVGQQVCDADDLPSLGWPFTNRNMFYEYEQEHRITEIKNEWTAEQVMDVFKKYPGDIFPFEVRACPTLVTGATCRLNAIPPLSVHGKGDVSVTTTATSVKFTVVSDTYFQGPGSTIEFRAEDRDGYVVLVQEGTVYNGELIAGIGTEFGGSLITWTQQAQNLRDKLAEQGRVG